MGVGVQVVYQAGVNEKLLGDFIRKHNVRDKVFSELFILSSMFSSLLSKGSFLIRLLFFFFPPVSCLMCGGLRKANLELVQDCIANPGHEHHRDQKRDEEFIRHFARNAMYCWKYCIEVLRRREGGEISNQRLSISRRQDWVGGENSSSIPGASNKYCKPK